MISNLNILNLGIRASNRHTDPFFDNVTLLLHFNGDTVIDKSPQNHTLAASGANQALSDVEVKFGGNSIKFSGTNSYLAYTNSATLGNFGTGDYTIEFWIFPTSTPTAANAHGLFDARPPSANGAGVPYAIFLNDSLQILAFNGTTSMTSTNSVTLNNWHHIAWTRSGTTARIFINGNLEGSVTDSTNLAPTETCTIGAAGNVRGTSSLFNYTGYIDDFRLTSGVARYTSEFTSTIPDKPFPDA